MQYNGAYPLFLSPSLAKRGQGRFYKSYATPYPFHHSAHILKNIPVRKPQNFYSHFPQNVVPCPILCLTSFRIVLSTVKLYHKIGLRTVKINDILPNNLLAVKRMPLQLLSFQS